MNNKKRKAAAWKTQKLTNIILLYTPSQTYTVVFLAFRLTADKPQCKHHHKLTCRFFFQKPTVFFEHDGKKSHTYTPNTPHYFILLIKNKKIYIKLLNIL